MGSERDLSLYRLSEAKRCIKAAELTYEAEDYKTAANRSYYAMFHCVRALLALERMDYKKHSAVIGHFRRKYIKSRIFDVRFSGYIGDAFEVRGQSDYKDFYVISKKAVWEQIEHAKELYQAVEIYINSKLSE